VLAHDERDVKSAEALGFSRGGNDGAVGCQTVPQVCHRRTTDQRGPGAFGHHRGVHRMIEMGMHR
jgi:hypothetical protein